MESSSLKIQRLNWWSSYRLRLEPKLKFPLIFYPHILPEETWFSPIVRSELMVPEHHLRNPKLEWPIDLKYAVRMHPRDKCWIAPIPFNRKMFVFMDIRPNNDFILLRVHFLQLIRTLSWHRFRKIVCSNVKRTDGLKAHLKVAEWTRDENGPSQNSLHLQRESWIHWLSEYAMKNTSHLSILRLRSVMPFMCPYPVI